MKKWTGCAALLLLCLGAYGQTKEKTAGGATREAVESKDAPKPIGPYSQAIKSGGFVFCAGQIALDPATGQLVTGDIAGAFSKTSPRCWPRPVLILIMRSRPLCISRTFLILAP